MVETDLKWEKKKMKMIACILGIVGMQHVFDKVKIVNPIHNPRPMLSSTL